MFLMDETVETGTGDFRENVDNHSLKKVVSLDLSCTKILKSKSEDQIFTTIKKKKLLIVDDVGTNRRMLRRLLELRGHHCEEAVDGLEALNMVEEALQFSNDKEGSDVNIGIDWKSRNYDAIFMDFVMPKMNGPEATRAIRELGYTGPVVGVTGNALHDDKLKFIHAGAKHVIIKPLKMNALLKIVDV